MTVVNQIFWQQADWDLLKKCVANPENYPAKIAVSHLYFEDLRKILWLLEHIHAGNIDESVNEWGVHRFPPSKPDPYYPDHLIPYGLKGDWEVTSEVNVHGANLWVPGILYVADSVVTYPTINDTSYRAKIDIDEAHSTTPPPQYADGWEVIESKRWVRWRNISDLYYSDCCVDPTNGNINWVSGTYYAAETRKFWDKSIYIALVNTSGTIPPDERTKYNNWTIDKVPAYLEDAKAIDDNSLYRAKRDVEDSHTPPSDNPNDWEWVEDFDWDLSFAGPPNPMHYETWQADKPGGYSETDCVSYQDGYKAKQDIENVELPPPKNLDEWEKINEGWITINSEWELAPSDNRYYDWDENFLGKARYLMGGGSGANCVQNYLECPAAAFYPHQVDPKEQYVPVIYVDTGQTGFQFKEKVAFRKEYITVPERLGARLKIWERERLVYHTPEFDPPFWTQERRDSYVIKDGEGVFPGNQYANYGVNWQNSNIEQSDEPGATEFSFNPKICGALQNKIEVVLSGGLFRLPASDLFKANFRILYNLTVGDYPNIDEYSGWDDYPDVNHECWGENEAGFEQFLKQRGQYDWYFNFDTNYNYVPFNVAEIAKGGTVGLRVGGIPPWHTVEDFKTMWDLNIAGLFRRTFKHSLGRVSPWMRSQEMGEPAHRRDPWNPNTNDHLMNYDSNLQYTADKWFGARTNEMPKLSDFDDKFKGITKTSDYSFTVTEDITANLKAGFMVHLCTTANGNEVISDNPVVIRPAYVLACEYDGEVTKVIISEKIDDFIHIGWNKEISERHDAIQVSYEWSGEALVYSLGYYPTVELILEMKELLDLTIYKEVCPTFDIKSAQWIGEWEAGDSHMSREAAVSLAISRMKSKINYDVEEGEGWGSGGGDILVQITGWFEE